MKYSPLLYKKGDKNMINNEDKVDTQGTDYKFCVSISTSINVKSAIIEIKKVNIRLRTSVKMRFVDTTRIKEHYFVTYSGALRFVTKRKDILAEKLLITDINIINLTEI